MDSIKLIDSSTNKLKMFKENILHEISTKWDSTFNENNAQNKSPKIIQRSKKNRSIYGQPQINLDHSTTMNIIRNSHHWKSLDSLDFSESNHSNYSNSTSLSDLRTIDCQKNQDWIVSDIGTSVESFENEQESMFKRCSSMNSSSSGCSVTTENQDELSREAKYFMKQFVEKIFLKSSSISLEEKAKFGYYSRMENGRLWFARYINRKRNDNKCVQESTFYSLAQYFAIILFECAESDDFTPAKILMNMLLRDQPIWKLKRFWNAAFFDAIQCERANFYENNRDQPNHKYYDWQFHANLTFGQLGTFTYNMNSFGLPKEFCLEFLRKQSTIANITNEQFKLLQDNIEAMYNAQK
ncbi:hypothetical protein DERP_004315 [Dermatophagoides pteronyssinus]|uniref:SBF1/SBF2 domain-containing protein n=1 Tax=Dermatophagoides pteronyssinus TaxID=6956 RepID=A0ABQ8JNF6_DERPT|nr:hypothetical protein DERP_004315 [Dermatophagoides pteronyssinus]